MANGKIIYFLMGAALGVAGARAARQGNSQQVLAGLVTGSYSLKEMVLTGIETIKEDVEDYLAQARFEHEEHARQTSREAQTPRASSSASTKKTTAAQTKKTAAPKTAAPKTATQKAATPKTATKKTTTGKKKATAKTSSAK